MQAMRRTSSDAPISTRANRALLRSPSTIITRPSRAARARRIVSCTWELRSPSSAARATPARHFASLMKSMGTRRRRTSATMPLPQKQKRAADAGSVERFAADLSALAGPDWHGKRYGVAVSGGPDSMALLWLMASLLPGQIAAATVDHRLRDASADEARMVAGYCAREHIPHAILHPATPIAGSLQAAARGERYRLLEQWREALALDHILTAHHADDQLETMIMRLNRSSGVGGLAGVRASNGAVLRPLLHWRRSELAALALDADLPIVEDPSNADRRFDRARLRHALRSQEFLDPQAASRSAQWLGDADTALD